jgi:hypothetical protein
MKRTFILFVIAAQLASCSLFKSEASPTEAPKPRADGPRAVAHEALAATLPRDVPGWKIETLPGAFIENGGNQLSRASANYSRSAEGEPGFFNLEVVDGTHVPAVRASLAILVHSVDDAHRMNVDVSGYQAIQQWLPESNSVTSTVVIANRFVVTLKGTNVPPELVGQALNRVDAKQLEALAGVANGPAAARAASAPSSSAGSGLTTVGSASAEAPSPSAPGRPQPTP